MYVLYVSTSFCNQTVNFSKHEKTHLPTFQPIICEVPLLFFTWCLCAVAPWLRAPRDLDDARGFRRRGTTSQPERSPYRPGGTLPALAPRETEETEDKGRKKETFCAMSGRMGGKLDLLVFCCQWASKLGT